MDTSDGSWHDQEGIERLRAEMGKVDIVFFPLGADVTVCLEGQKPVAFIVCREKNNRLILRGKNAKATLREIEVERTFRDRSNTILGG